MYNASSSFCVENYDSEAYVVLCVYHLECLCVIIDTVFWSCRFFEETNLLGSLIFNPSAVLFPFKARGWTHSCNWIATLKGHIEEELTEEIDKELKNQFSYFVPLYPSRRLSQAELDENGAIAVDIHDSHCY